MTNLPEKPTIKSLLSSDQVKNRFKDILQNKAPGFISSILSVVNGSAELQKCEPMTIIGAAVIAASLDLPIVPGLGFAGIVPYYNGKKKVYEAQFQIFKKGFIQLAQRSGQIKTIHSGPVYEGQLKDYNPFTGDFEFDHRGQKSEKIIGYVGFVRFINGFEKYKYMTIDELEKHAHKYSSSYRKGFGKWADKEEGGFEQMCEKTVIKLLLSGYAPLSIEMQRAVMADQAVIEGESEPAYIDNPQSIDIDRINNEKERDRILWHIAGCELDDLDILEATAPEYKAEIEARRKQLTDGK